MVLRLPLARFHNCTPTLLAIICGIPCVSPRNTRNDICWLYEEDRYNFQGRGPFIRACLWKNGGVRRIGLQSYLRSTTHQYRQMQHLIADIEYSETQDILPTPDQRYYRASNEEEGLEHYIRFLRAKMGAVKRFPKTCVQLRSLTLAFSRFSEPSELLVDSPMFTAMRDILEPLVIFREGVSFEKSGSG